MREVIENQFTTIECNDSEIRLISLARDKITNILINKGHRIDKAFTDALTWRLLGVLKREGEAGVVRFADEFKAIAPIEKRYIGYATYECVGEIKK